MSIVRRGCAVGATCLLVSSHTCGSQHCIHNLYLMHIQLVLTLVLGHCLLVPDLQYTCLCLLSVMSVLWERFWSGLLLVAGRGLLTGLKPLIPYVVSGQLRAILEV